ncbi:MAG: hypothetical protein LBU91_09465 [Bacteroidales bacterium]|jgi:hypothetical protein|nr:hypothetical protein [Bacteroidales bacterium]
MKQTLLNIIVANRPFGKNGVALSEQDCLSAKTPLLCRSKTVFLKKHLCSIGAGLSFCKNTFAPSEQDHLFEKTSLLCRSKTVFLKKRLCSIRARLSF